MSSNKRQSTAQSSTDELMEAVVKLAVSDYKRGPTQGHERDYATAKVFLQESGLLVHVERAIAQRKQQKAHVQRPPSVSASNYTRGQRC